MAKTFTVKVGIHRTDLPNIVFVAEVEDITPEQIREGVFDEGMKEGLRTLLDRYEERVSETDTPESAQFKLGKPEGPVQ